MLFRSRVAKHEHFIKLLLQLIKFNPKYVNDGVFVLSHSRLDCCNFGDINLYKYFLKETKTNVSDACIAATAVENGFYLLTKDSWLYKKMKERNYKVLSLDDISDYFAHTTEE